MIKCEICGMKFTEEIRYQRHLKTHQNKTKRTKKPVMPDFNKPDFSQVM